MSNEKHTCTSMVSRDGGWHSGVCGKNAKFFEESEWWCGIHKPSKKKDKEAKWKQEREARDMNNKALDAGQNILDQLASWEPIGDLPWWLQNPVLHWQDDVKKATEARIAYQKQHGPMPR